MHTNINVHVEKKGKFVFILWCLIFFNKTVQSDLDFRLEGAQMVGLWFIVIIIIKHALYEYM